MIEHSPKILTSEKKATTTDMIVSFVLLHNFSIHLSKGTDASSTPAEISRVGVLYEL